jgi:hypothetical protein
VLTVTGTPAGYTLAPNLGPGNDSFNLTAPGLVLSGDANTGGSNAKVLVSSTTTFLTPQHLSELHLASAAAATLSPGNGRLIRTGLLDLGAGSALDLNDGSLIVDYGGTSPVSQIQSALASGYNGGAWNGPGINSTVAHNDATGRSALGFAEAADIFTSFPASFAGESVDDTAVLVRKTIYGDADLNGSVNLQDFNRLAAAFGTTGSPRWSSGNFDYDNDVDLADFNKFAGTFGQAAIAASPGSFGPRPSMKSLLDQLRAADPTLF